MKNPYEFSICKRFSNAHKLILTMKLSLFLIFTGILQVSASVYSQNTKMTFTMTDKPVKEVLEQIEGVTEFRFFYNESFTDLDKKVTIQAKDENINEILDDIFVSLNVSYKVLENNLIIIAPKSLIQQMRVTGTVTDAKTGEPIIGANVIIEGTTIGAATDINGKFSIDVASSTSTLVISLSVIILEKVTLSGQSTFDIKLIPDIKSLDEIVVIGYGTQKKSDLTGSVDRVSVSGKASQSNSNLLQALSGASARCEYSGIWAVGC